MASTGATACNGQDCAAGKYSTAGSVASVACKICDAGKYEHRTASTACIACATGKYQGSTGEKACHNCAAGKSMASTGAAACNACTTGRYEHRTASTACIACAAGKYGKYQGSTGEKACHNCVAGKFMASTGATACNACATGRYEHRAASTACIACSAGRFNGATGKSQSFACFACAVGKSTRGQSGRASCSSCAAGQYQAMTGNARCIACAAGKYQTLTQQTGCTKCARDKHNVHTGKSRVADCTDCNAGTQPSADRSKCDSCVSGRYQQDKGGVRCDQCERSGSYSTPVGAKTGTECICPVASLYEFCQPPYGRVMYAATQKQWVAPVDADRLPWTVCKEDTDCPAATHPECITGKCYKKQDMSCGCKCANDKVYSGKFCNECVRKCKAGTLDTDSCKCKCDVVNTGMGGGFCEKPVLKCAFDGIAFVDKTVVGGWTAKCTCPKDGVTNKPIATGRTCNTCVRKCQNGGRVDPESCTCRCPKSHSGEMCETCSLKQSDCQNGARFDAKTCKCTCGSDFKGFDCGVPAAANCFNGLEMGYQYVKD